MLAAERRTSMGALIREALEEKSAAYRPKPRSLGIGDSGRTDTARRSADERPVPPADLVTAFWVLVLGHATFQGLLWGVGTAIFMDVTTARVAATQFTAYMALTNFATSYTSTWQGHALERWGYPATLTLDCAFGVVTLGLVLNEPPPSPAIHLEPGTWDTEMPSSDVARGAKRPSHPAVARPPRSPGRSSSS